MNLDVTTKKGYDIATALRGPDKLTDDGNATATIAKLLTTSVLRHFAGLPHDPASITLRPATEDQDVIEVGEHHGSYVVTPAMAREVWSKLYIDQQALVRGYLRREGHFARHFTAAMEHVMQNNDAAREYMYWLGDIGVA